MYRRINSVREKVDGAIGQNDVSATGVVAPRREVAGPVGDDVGNFTVASRVAVS